MTREQLILDRIECRLRSVLDAVPPLKAPSAYWLHSDAGPSYCRRCVRIARGREFELGLLLQYVRPYLRDDWEDTFWDGVDGGFDTTSDNTAACEICRITLSYILTDYGVDDELTYWVENPLTDVRDEDAYALDRICLNLFDGSKRSTILAAAIAVGQAFRLAAAGRAIVADKHPGHADGAGLS